MQENDRFSLGKEGAVFYQDALNISSEYLLKRSEVLQSLVSSEEQVWERCAQGLIKHMVNDSMDSAEFAVEMYQQVLAPSGHSGRHRHYSEEVLFILEGRGYDLHWDPIFRADEHYEWDWEEVPKQYEWQAGDFVYIPPLSVHQHFAESVGRARFLCATSRLVRSMMGHDGLEQLEDASDLSAIMF